MIKAYILLLLLSLISGCTAKREKFIGSVSNIHFIVDTTLQRQYLDVKPFDNPDTLQTKNPICSAEEVFQKIKPNINRLITKGVIWNNQVFHINLVYDSIWVIWSKPMTEANELLFGGTIYYEIHRNDGYLLKSVLEE